jgi:hypothetical protein
MAGSMIAVKFSRKNYIQIHHWLTTSFVVLLVLEALSLAPSPARARTSLHPGFDYDSLGIASPLHVEKERDIVYIVLDAHTSSASLLHLWHFNEEGFLDSLGKRGFFVARDSRSMNTQTLRSQASTLNMSDHPDFSTLPEESILRLIKESAVIRFVRKNGYVIRNFSGFDLSDQPRFYGIALWEEEDYKWLRAFYATLPVQLMIQYYALELPGTFDKIRSGISTLMKDSKRPPAFYYAHFLSPHPPYVYDNSGNVLPPAQRNGSDEKAAYLANLEGNDHLVLNFIDTLLAAPGLKPIIILQGDHGSRLFGATPDKPESYTILNAYYLPGNETHHLSESISPYNSFRVVLNLYFGQHLPLLKDGLKG